MKPRSSRFSFDYYDIALLSLDAQFDFPPGCRAKPKEGRVRNPDSDHLTHNPRSGSIKTKYIQIWRLRFMRHHTVQQSNAKANNVIDCFGDTKII